MANKGIYKDGYKYMYLITAAVCLVIAGVIALILVCGNLFKEEETGIVVSDVSIPQAVTEESVLEDVSDVDNTADFITYKEYAIQNNTLSNGDLIIIKNSENSSAPDKAKLSLANIYANKLKLYVLSTTKLELKKEAIDAFNKMIQDFYSSTNNKNIMINDAYNSLNQLKNNKSISDYVDLASGKTVRLAVYPPDSGKIGEGVYHWIADNCHNYGYILRYPEEKIEQTGVEPSASVFRYVGIVHAKYMQKNNLCLEEYIDLLKKYNYKSPLIFTDADSGENFRIYYQTAEKGASTTAHVPEELEYTVSGDNSGGFIITVSEGLENQQ